MMSKYKIKFFYPNYFTGKAISYVCLSLAEQINSDLFETSIMGISSSKEVKSLIYTNAIPSILIGLAYRLFKKETLARFAEFRFKCSVSKGDIVYLWPGSSVSLFQKLKEKGCVLIRENINTHTAYAKTLLEKEYSSAKLKDSNPISENLIKMEIESQKYTDFVFSPSPIVSNSLEKYGVPVDTILGVSYGLKQNEILSEKSNRCYQDDSYVTAIFVGRICVRKGVHILLDAWSKANINGRLILVGAIDENIKEFVLGYLSKNITHIEHTYDLSSIYADADFFVLPSIEEGSPLVTYLALGAGLPSIVSPMGSGGIIEHTEGFIIEPNDQVEWVNAIKTLAANGKLRKSMGESAHRKSQEYTWDKVGNKRAELLYEKLQKINK